MRFSKSFRSTRTSLFFFSSRRLHTIFSRDWSSDVCSSDLRAFSGTSLTWPVSAGEASVDPIEPDRPRTKGRSKTARLGHAPERADDYDQAKAGTRMRDPDAATTTDGAQATDRGDDPPGHGGASRGPRRRR